jgi:hypothetical protein
MASIQYGIMTYAGLRQVEALRESVAGSFRGGIIDERLKKTWLRDQGLTDFNFPSDSTVSQVPWYVLESRFRESIGEPLGLVVKASDAPKIAGIGADRSGAGWWQLDNFILSSAFVRLLGAGEQLEMDVLKALFYYRPSGLLGPLEEQAEITVDDSILLEEPEVDHDKRIYNKPPVWTWLRKQAENNVERKRIFNNVFQIQTVPDGQGKQRDKWYDMRNAIVHGRQGVTVTLLEYSDLEIFIVRSMFFLCRQCRDKLKLIV